MPATKLLRLFLLHLNVSTFCYPQENKSLPAWNPDFVCLAPFASEARSEKSPLKFEQAFFDGPFQRAILDEKISPIPFDLSSLEPQAERYFRQGLAYLIGFHDHEAERNFREVITLDPGCIVGYVGLALANLDFPTRRNCFLQEAENRDHSGLLDFEIDFFEAANSSQFDFQAFAQKYPNEPFAQLLHIRVSLQKSKEEKIPESKVAIFGEILDQVAQNFPELQIEHLRYLLSAKHDPTIISRSPFPHSLRLLAENFLKKGEIAQAHSLLSKSVNLELQNLSKRNYAMPDGGQNYGETLAWLIRTTNRLNGIEKKPHTAQRDLLTIPYNPWANESRWRRVDRDTATWIRVRREWARSKFMETPIGDFSQIPRGFLPADKAEWFAWQSIAVRLREQDYNIWLGALRRYDVNETVISEVEHILQWIDTREGELTLIPGIPEEIFEASNAHPQSGSGKKIRTDRIPKWSGGLAPSLTLPNWQYEKVTLDRYQGKPVIVIFFLGGGCLHCVQQLTAFTPWAKKFRDAGIEIIAVSTDEVEYLAETISAEDSVAEQFPIPIISAHGTKTFEEWGVRDEFMSRDLHGTFVINAQGEIVWKETGNEPFMHPDFLHYEAQRLLFGIK